MTIEEIRKGAPDVITYKQAKELGLNYYYTGNPCMYNQLAKRNIKTRHCLCFICVAKQNHKELEYANNNRDKERERIKNWGKRKELNQEILPS